MREMGLKIERVAERLGQEYRTTAGIYGTLPKVRDRAVADQLGELYRKNRPPNQMSPRGHVSQGHIPDRPACR